MAGYTVYGDLAHRETAVLTSLLVAKSLDFELVEETASLSLLLATRAGREFGPYLRTPEGFVLSDLHAMLDWIEQMHPERRLLPTTPVRRTCARLIEDWLEFWLPLWPRGSWEGVVRLGRHLEATRFLLGAEPSRPDWLLAGWLETEVLVHDHARAHLTRTARPLISLARDLLENTRIECDDDVIPITLLPILAEIASDYHGYLVKNQRACKDRLDRVILDLGFGRRAMPVRRVCEERRAEIGRELIRRNPAERREVRQVLEPVGAWYALTLPPVIAESDPSDPRSL